MADSIVVKRIAQRLREAAEATPKGEGFWPTLADVAARECERTVATLNKPLPAMPVLALGVTREGFTTLVDGATLAEVYAQVLPLFDAGQSGDVWIVDVKRIISGA